MPFFKPGEDRPSIRVNSLSHAVSLENSEESTADLGPGDPISNDSRSHAFKLDLEFALEVHAQHGDALIFMEGDSAIPCPSVLMDDGRGWMVSPLQQV